MNCAVVEADPGAVGEALPTEAADEGPLSRVDAGMDLKSSRLGETFPTLATAVGLLSCVGPLVGPDPCQMGKPPAAKSTGIRPFTCVNPPVDLQSPRLAETLPAVRAGVGPGPSVHVEVDAEVAVRVEGPAALGAEEAGRLVGVLRALVLQQLGRPGKSGRAVHARIQRQHGRGRPASLLLLRSVCLSVARLSAGGKGALARQAGKRPRELWGMRAGKLRAGQTRRYRTVVVMKMMGVGARERGVCAFLVAQYLGAGLQVAMATQAGKHGEVGQGARGRSGRGEGF